MSARRTTALAALAGAVLSVLSVLAPGARPAFAHGATSAPASRALECGPLGGAAATSAACRAADAVAGGPMPFTDWDNLRVPGVNGQDRQRIPDGKLCSAGLAGFHGLDLARADWPATTLVAGAGFTFQYRVTVPHKGSFRLYLTGDGYSPTRPLRWADLAAVPFLTVTDPPIRDGAYTARGTLPAAKPGRYLIYTIWQTTSTPDTYYSCSDVVLTAGATAAAPVPATVPASAAPGTRTAAPATAGTPLAAAGGTAAAVLPYAGLGGGVVLLGGALLLVRARRTQARAGRHTGRRVPRGGYPPPGR